MCDANCSLRDAVHAANQNGAGADIINVPAGIYTLDAVDNNDTGTNALPAVSSQMTIQGAGAASTIVERSSAAGTPDFRFFRVGGGGQLTLNNLTFRNGRISSNNGGVMSVESSGGTVTVNGCSFENNFAPSGNGGGVITAFTVGQLTINNSTFTNNSAGVGGVINGGPNMGNLTVTNSTFTGNSATFSDGGVIVHYGPGPINDFRQHFHRQLGGSRRSDSGEYVN